MTKALIMVLGGKIFPSAELLDGKVYTVIMLWLVFPEGLKIS